jgi:hypothetical protein
LLRIDEHSNFIDLNALAIEIAEYAILILSSSLACIDHQFSDRLFARASQSGHCTD